MNQPNINNSSCAVLRRSSSIGQGTSINNQGKTIDAAIAEHHLIVVHEEVLEGVTGSVPGNRTDIDRIIEQKRIYNNFNLLLVPDASRFTRAGAGHGSKLIYELRAAGIMVLFVVEGILVYNELTAMYVSFLLHAAHETAKAISRGSTTGTTQSFLSGRSPYTRIPPIGMDRMYSLDGKDLHIIRNLPDGTQHMLNPQTGELIRTFEKNNKKGVPNHYIKQKNEKVRLVRGDPKLIAAVHLIYFLHHMKKLSHHRVAKHLNDVNIRSAKGKDWHTATVGHVLTNAAYIGRGIRYLKAVGIYNIGGKDSPTPSGVDLKELNEHKHIRPRMRPQDDWRERDMPELQDFLQPELREMAKAKIEGYLGSIADGKQPTPKRDRHLQTPYLLKGILRSKQGGYLMTGRKGKNGRKYAVSRAQSVPKTDNVLAHRVAAEPIEHMVLDTLKLVFNEQAIIVKKLREQFKLLQTQGKDEKTAPALQKAIDRKRRQLAFLSDDITGDELDHDPVMVKRAAIREELRQLEAQLRSIQLPLPAHQTDPAMAIERFATELQTWINSFESGACVPPEDVPHVNAILQLLISKLEVDLVTKEVEMVVALPSWVSERLTQPKVGLDSLSAYRQHIEAHPENGLEIEVIQCNGHGRPLCFKCRRTKHAA